MIIHLCEKVARGVSSIVSSNLFESLLENRHASPPSLRNLIAGITIDGKAAAPGALHRSGVSADVTSAHKISRNHRGSATDGDGHEKRWQHPHQRSNCMSITASRARALQIAWTLSWHARSVPFEAPCLMLKACSSLHRRSTEKRPASRVRACLECVEYAIVERIFELVLVCRDLLMIYEAR